jgi:hypothetical protein
MNRRALLSAALGAATLTACTPHQKVTAGPTTPAVPERKPGIEVVQGTLEGGAPKAGILVTPHSQHELTDVTVTRQLDDLAAEQLSLQAFAAPAGYELVIASFKMPGPPPYTGGSAKAQVSVVSGKLSEPVDLFGTYNSISKLYTTILPQTVVACVPIGAPTVLRVIDAGRTATLDLRTGRQSGASPLSAYRSAATLGKGETATGAVITRPGRKFLPEGGKYDLTYSFTDAAFSLTPWTPTNGWAPHGTTWAVLSGVSISGAIADTPNKERKLIITNLLDLPTSIHLTPHGGRPMPAPRGTYKVPLIAIPYGNDDIPDIVWPVPQSFTRGTLEISPHGKLSVTYNNGTVPAAWISRPAPFRVPVNLG